MEPAETARRPAVPRVSRRGLAVDAGIAVTLGVLLVLNGYVLQGLDLPGAPELTAATWVSGVAMCAVLALRRVTPLIVVVVAGVTFVIYTLSGGLDGFGSNVALFLALVTAGSHGRAPWRDRVRALVVAGMFGWLFYEFTFGSGSDAGTGIFAVAVGQLYGVALNVFYFGAAWVFGDQIRARYEREADLAQRTAQLTARTVELEAERERSRREAATAERLRIARELHDVLGHHVSVMGVQAGAARRVLDRDPARAGDALGAIETSSRQAVTELQRVLRLLREPRDDRRPLGTLDRLDELAAELRHAGLEVTVQVGVLPALPVDVELAAVRVLQESLTNALRHAGPGSSVWVKVRSEGGVLHLEVGDDGRGTPVPVGGEPDGIARGSGLTGMRERVELHGGTFEAGPARGRGWRVIATLAEAGLDARAVGS